MESAYTQLLDTFTTSDLADNQAESKLDHRDHDFPDPQETSQLLSDVTHCPLRPPPRSYISSPLSSAVVSFPNTFEPDSSSSNFSSKLHNDGLLASPNSDHNRVVSSSSRVLFQLPDENGVLSGREKSTFQPASTQHFSTSSSRESTLLHPCDYSRYPSDKPRKLIGIIVYDHDIYEHNEPDDDDWLYTIDSDAQLQCNGFACSRRGIANVGFLTLVLVTLLFFFVGLPIYNQSIMDQGGW